MNIILILFITAFLTIFSGIYGEWKMYKNNSIGCASDKRELERTYGIIIACTIIFSLIFLLIGYPQFSSNSVGKQGTDNRCSHLSVGDRL